MKTMTLGPNPVTAAGVEHRPRILIMSASVMAGHVRAAQAVELAMRQTVPHALVRNLDVLDLTNAAFRRLYARAYLNLVNRAPHVLGYFYDWLDQPTRLNKRSRADRLRLVVERLNLRRFVRFLGSEPWDLIINTHFLPAEIVASLRRTGQLLVPQVTVTTDFETHRLWVNQPCDHYFTATEEGARYLHYLGVPAGDTTATGIPIHPHFSQPKDRAACLRKQGLVGDRPVVLHLTGGMGVGPIEKVFRALLQVEVPLEIVTITGRNVRAIGELEKVPVPPRHRARILGYTTEMEQFMAVADLVVSKPGGLTTSETLASGAAMAVVTPIPGQESRNSDFLLENGAAIKVNQIATLAYKVTALLSEPERLEQLKANARRISQPRAAFAVAERSLEMLHHWKARLRSGATG
jgi:processive 1,2-diacylglycerol beta-glucosyltransferase